MSSYRTVKNIFFMGISSYRTMKNKLSAPRQKVSKNAPG